jgi:hypothetical protein
MSGYTTFTFTNTAGGPISNSWTTATDWSPNAATADFKTGSANFGAVSIFEVGTPTNAITTSVTLTPNSGSTINTFIMNDPNGTLAASSSGGSYTFVNGITLDAGTILATATTSTFSIGLSSQQIQSGLTVGPVAGTIDILSTGVIEGNGGTTILRGPNVSYMATIEGSGTIDSHTGVLDISSTASVAAGQSLTFDIDNGATLQFDGAVNSGTIDFTSGNGLLTLTGTQVGQNGTLTNGGTFGAPISGMVGGSTGIAIKLATGSVQPTLSAQLLNATPSGATLEIIDGASNTFNFNLLGNYIGESATVVSLGAAGAQIELSVCFASGTAILTEQGETPVEAIKAGDSVMALVDGVPTDRIVKWAGERTLDLTRHPKRELAAPVRFLKGALGDNLPHRDLVVSPDHCMFIDGGLIPAKLLVNGMTIVRDLDAATVTYHHIELEQHGILIAEGVASESYLDTGNRAFFANAGLATLLHPDLTINENLRCWEEDACAPLTVSPDAVKPVWDRFAARAQALGFAAPEFEMTNDAAVHLVVDGKRVRPTQSRDGMASFMVPAGARSVRLVSRSVTPGKLTPWHDDFRSLGVAVRSVTLRDRAAVTVLSADHPALTTGWHAAETAADGTMWRWTDGDEILPIHGAGAFSVDVAFHTASTYEHEDRLAA